MEQLLNDLLRIPTANPPGNERALATFIAEHLRDTPCEVSCQDVAEGRANVTAILRGKSRENALLLNGHLDTVPFGAGWDTDPIEPVRDGDWLRARGASDMKSGLAAMLYAFRQFALGGKQPERDVIFLGTADEEAYGLGAHAAGKAGLLAHVGTAIIGEPTGNRIGVASKGVLWLQVQAAGRTCHGAYPDRGINAVRLAVSLADGIESLLAGQRHPLLGNSTCTITQISGGIKINMVPDACDMLLDIRATPGVDQDGLLQDALGLAEMLERAHPGARITLTALTNRPPVLAEADGAAVRRLGEIVGGVTGRQAEHTGTAFFSDASVFCRYKAAEYILFGPGESDQAHQPNERVSLAQYRQAVAVYQQVLAEMA